MDERFWMTGSIAAAVAASMLLLAACEASDEAGTTGASTSTPVPSASYTEEERALYRQAVRRVHDFETENQKILAVGEATQQAKRFYRSRLQDWKAEYRRLQRFEREDIRIARGPVVLSTRATSIASFQDNAAEIVLVRCTDQSDLGMTRHRERVPAVHREPVIQEVVVHRYENRTWAIGEFTTTGRPCGD